MFSKRPARKRPTTAQVIDMIARTETMRARGKEQKAAFLAAVRAGPARVGGRANRNLRSAGFLGLELKFIDQAGQGLAITAPTDSAGAEHDPATALCVGFPGQGDGPSDRDGRTYVVKSIDIAGTIVCQAQANQTAADVAGSVVVFLVQDTQTNAAQLNSEDVFTNPSALAVVADQPFRNLLHIKRFRILDTARVKLEQPEMVYDGTNIEQGGVYRSFKLSWRGNTKVVATGTGATVASIDDNSFHIIAYASNVNMAPLLNYNARTRFMG